MNRSLLVMVLVGSLMMCKVVAAQTENESSRSGTPPTDAATTTASSPSQPVPVISPPSSQSSTAPTISTTQPGQTQAAPYGAGQQPYMGPPAPGDPVQARLMAREARYQERLRRKEEASLSGRPLILSGAITLGVGYMVSMLVGSILVDARENQAALMFIPIAGNPIYLSILLKEIREDGHDDAPKFLLSMAMLTPAIAQLTGTILLTAGLIKHSRHKKEKSTYAFAPTVTANARGLSFAMTF